MARNRTRLSAAGAKRATHHGWHYLHQPFLGKDYVGRSAGARRAGQHESRAMCIDQRFGEGQAKPCSRLLAWRGIELVEWLHRALDIVCRLLLEKKQMQS